MNYYFLGLCILAAIVGIYCKIKRVTVRKGTPSKIETLIAIAVLIILLVVTR